MVPAVGRGEILNRKPRVDLGRGDGGVAEDELDVANVGTALE